MLACWYLESTSVFREKTTEAPSPHWTGSVLASFMMNAALAKAEPISDTGNVSVITYLRKGEKCCTAASGREEWENMRETSLQTPRTLEKQREEVLQVPGQRFLCSLWYRPWWANRGCSPEALTITVDQMAPCWSRWLCLEQSCSPWTSHTGAGSWQELWRRDHTGASFLVGFESPWGTHSEAAHS